MSKIQPWLDEYAVSHQNPTNQLIHWVCVPLIMLSLIGLLYSIPAPAFAPDIVPGLSLGNWGLVFMAVVLIYYFTLSPPIALGMIFVSVAMLAINYLLASLVPFPLWAISIGIFVLTWIGQFIGHKIEGAKPSFFKDLQFFLIGPAWLLSKVYKKAGINF